MRLKKSLNWEKNATFLTSAENFRQLQKFCWYLPGLKLISKQGQADDSPNSLLRNLFKQYIVRQEAGIFWEEDNRKEYDIRI